jgi:hypothetical protein
MSIEGALSNLSLQSPEDFVYEQFSGLLKQELTQFPNTLSRNGHLSAHILFDDLEKIDFLTRCQIKSGEAFAVSVANLQERPTLEMCQRIGDRIVREIGQRYTVSKIAKEGNCISIISLGEFRSSRIAGPAEGHRVIKRDGSYETVDTKKEEAIKMHVLNAAVEYLSFHGDLRNVHIAMDRIFGTKFQMSAYACGLRDNIGDTMEPITVRVINNKAPQLPAKGRVVCHALRAGLTLSDSIRLVEQIRQELGLEPKCTFFEGDQPVESKKILGNPYEPMVVDFQVDRTNWRKLASYNLRVLEHTRSEPVSAQSYQPNFANLDAWSPAPYSNVGVYISYRK